MEETLDLSLDQPFADIVLYGSLDSGFQIAIPFDTYEETGRPNQAKIVID